MSQIVNGVVLGAPGPIGSPLLVILYGQGAPANSTDPAVAAAQLGSLYIDYIGGTLYVLQTGGWTAK